MPRKQLAGSNSSTVKIHNLRAVLRALLRHDYISRVRLADLTGLSTTTITNLIAELIQQGIVSEEGSEHLPQRSGAGRPRTALRLVPEARYAIGVHLGVGRVRIAITDLRARIIHQLSLVYPVRQAAETVLTEIAEAIQELLDKYEIASENVVGVGVGASGLVNPVSGVNLLAPNWGWHQVPIVEYLSQQLDLPVCLDNNVRVMALGEAMFGMGEETRLLAFVYAQTRVGVSFVMEGQLYRSDRVWSGELGHINILPEGGELCSCGNRGCLETLFSEAALLKGVVQMLTEKGIHPNSATQLISIEQVLDMARAGHQDIRDLLLQRAHYMGLALANVVNVMNPEMILVGGLLAEGEDIFLPIIKQTIRKRAFADLGQQVQIEPTHFAQEAGMVGGAALALASFFYQFRPSPLPTPQINI